MLLVSPIPLNILKEYFAVPYNGSFFVYTNRIEVDEIPQHTFLELLSHERAVDGRSVAMSIHEAIKKHVGDFKGKKVLDLGCSIGHFSFMIAREGANVTGVDCIADKVKVAKAIAQIRNLPNAQFIQAFVEDYINTDETFDLVLMHNVFDYIPIQHGTNVLKRISQISPNLYSTVLIDPQFVLKHSNYTNAEKLLTKIYGPRDLWAFW